MCPASDPQRPDALGGDEPPETDLLTAEPVNTTSGLRAITRQIGAVAVGLAVLGVASFAFLSLSGRALGPRAFAALGTLWVLINAAGP
ncbi:MAG: hypothetical protein ACXVX8_14240, partial [Blastococcus sp.]